MLSRRIAHRQLLIRPSDLINRIFLYCIAVAANRSHMAIHAVVVLGNHVHIVLTDPEARLPEFSRWLFEFTAKCVNASLGRWENLWSSEDPSVVRLEHPDDFLDKVLYTMANPVAAALVGKSEDYPGVVTQPKDYLEGPIEVRRPEVFFRKRGPTPATAKLELVPPPGFEELGVEGFAELVRGELEAREMDLRVQHRDAERPILGRKGVLEQDPYAYPGSREPRRGLSPRVGAKNKWRRVEALRRVVEFVRDHAKALRRFVGGDREVLFPAGTYWARVYLAVRCLEPA
jgi:REP-associated tyrosine transposase